MYKWPKRQRVNGNIFTYKIKMYNKIERLTCEQEKLY